MELIQVVGSLLDSRSLLKRGALVPIRQSLAYPCRSIPNQTQPASGNPIRVTNSTRHGCVPGIRTGRGSGAPYPKLRGATTIQMQGQSIHRHIQRKLQTAVSVAEPTASSGERCGPRSRGPSTWDAPTKRTQSVDSLLASPQSNSWPWLPDLPPNPHLP